MEEIKHQAGEQNPGDDKNRNAIIPVPVREYVAEYVMPDCQKARIKYQGTSSTHFLLYKSVVTEII